ncbi:hypothetical protein KFE80_03245 [bacterium SCSIO 12696]|nr:hypothetical protein KFE80_03245 [bacterium SCSIO 12696]
MSVKSLPPIVLSIIIGITSTGVISSESDLIPEPILTSWKKRWDKHAKDIAEKLVDGYGAKLTAVESTKRVQFLSEMRTLFISKISWQALGSIETPKLLLRHCGVELLESVSPYYEGKLEFDSIPEETQKRLLSCSSDVELYVTTTPIYALYPVAKKELGELFKKHQIDENLLRRKR